MTDLTGLSSFELAERYAQAGREQDCGAACGDCYACLAEAMTGERPMAQERPDE